MLASSFNWPIFNQLFWATSTSHWHSKAQRRRHSVPIQQARDGRQWRQPLSHQGPPQVVPYQPCLYGDSPPASTAAISPPEPITSNQPGSALLALLAKRIVTGEFIEFSDLPPAKARLPLLRTWKHPKTLGTWKEENKILWGSLLAGLCLSYVLCLMGRPRQAC